MARGKCTPENWAFIARIKQTTETTPHSYETLPPGPELDFVSERAVKLNEQKGRNPLADLSAAELRPIAREMVDKFGKDYAVLVKRARCLRGT